MAGQKDGIFREQLSPFLKEKYLLAAKNPEECKDIIKMIEKQYIYDEEECQVKETENRRHYEAEIDISYKGDVLRGVEKLYNKTILIEPTTICAAHCRWCLRGRYDILHLSEKEIVNIAKYCGEAEENRDVEEVLITGGDPLMVPERIQFLFEQLEKYAPQIVVYRIGTRVPVHQPDRINNRMIEVLTSPKNARVELGLQINHYSEFFPEAEAALRALVENQIILYDQSVLLRGLNDDLETLVKLYRKFRDFGVEAHYLFHCIPLKGMAHHRTSVEKGLQLVKQLTSSGKISGRCKPSYALLTDVGKVTLYEGAILDKDKNHRILVQTGYLYEDRKKWTPSWTLPDSATVDESGYLRVWYQDV